MTNVSHREMSAEFDGIFAPETQRINMADDQTFAEFLPEHGGMLNRLVLDAGQGPVDVIAGIHDAKTLADNRQYRGVHLFPFPNRLENGNYNFSGREYQFPINEIELNNALHGFFYQINPDKIIKWGHDRLQLMFYCDGCRSYYPFPCSVMIEYHLQSAADFSVQFSVTNLGKTPLPVGIGWHPYFQLQQPVDELALYLPRVRRVLVNERLLPTGEKQEYGAFSSLRPIANTRFDDCFEIQDPGAFASVQLWSEKQQRGLEIWQESGNRGCRFLQICTAPDRQSIAIEPMSCSINAFNSHDGLRILAPGESFSTRFGVKLVCEMAQLTESSKH